MSVTVLILNLHDSCNFIKRAISRIGCDLSGQIICRYLLQETDGCQPPLFLKHNPYHWVEHINMLSLHPTKKLSISVYLHRGESSVERVPSGFACQHLPNICSSVILGFADWAALSTLAWSSKLCFAWASVKATQLTLRCWWCVSLCAD